MPILRNFASVLLPDAVYQMAKSAKSYVDARAALPHHLNRIRREFPDLSFAEARIINSGFANTVVILDESWVFRFPRNESRRLAFEREVRLLAELRPLARLDLPHYRWVASGYSFGGYPLIQGQALKPAFFLQLDHQVQREILMSFAAFLNALHALPASFVTTGGETRKAQTNASASDWYFNEKREYFAKVIDGELLTSLDRFYHTFRDVEPFEARLINSDIDDDHVFFDPRTGSLGLIDFGDVTIGDPALDFAFLHAYPNWAAPFVIAHYKFGDTDPGLLERANWHFVRRLGDRLWFGLLREGHPHSPLETVSQLRDQLRLLNL